MFKMPPCGFFECPWESHKPAKQTKHKNDGILNIANHWPLLDIDWHCCFGKFRGVEEMSQDDLMAWYKGVGLPEERDLQRADVQKLLKLVITWEALPFRELQNQCVQILIC